MFKRQTSHAVVFLLIAWGALAVPAVIAQPAAQAWPTRPITMVVPFGVGSALDLMGRVVGARMSEILGQSVVIENVSGGGGLTGAARVAKAPPDGYQVLLGGVDAMAMSQTLYKNPPYKTLTDFAPVGLVGDQAMVLIARNDLPANNLQEFIAYVKSNQAKMQFASGGAGSGAHLNCARVNAAIGVTVTHVPYRGSAQALQDLFAGRIDYYCALGAAASGPIESKSAKGIAILTRDRSPLFPNLASANEQGLTGFHADFWTGLFLPKDTPEPIVQKMNQALIETLTTPAVQERLLKIAVTPVASDRRSTGYLKSYVEGEIKLWEGTIKASGVVLD
jgi:tripartite-type tricarboxylate transporter receptor subunit TctC